MKILICGAWVIGGYLTHVLREAGDNVILLAQGNWRETLDWAFAALRKCKRV